MARSVIVTGGFGVLGQAVAKAFADAGDKVARIDFAPSSPPALPGALDIGGVDLTDAAATQAALDQVVAAQGGIDVLINVAGGFIWETLADGNGDLVKALGLEMDGSGFGLGARGQRFSMIVDDGTVTQLNVEAPGEYKVSAAEHMLGQL